MNHVRHQPRHVEYPQAPENNVSLPSNGKRVVIIGAGLTGLMLASELLDRGFKVTVLERSRISGGRLMAWDEPGFTCPAGVQLERALHGVWWSYRNLREFFGRRGIKLRTRWANAPEAVFSVVDPSGRVRAFKAARKLPSVLHAYGLKRCAERQAAEPFRLKLPQLMALMAFDSHDPEEVKALDAISMADWVRSHGIPEPFLNEFIDPLLRMCNFRSATESSALAWHRYTASHYGHWRDVEAVQFFDDITSEAIFEPLLASIRQRGGSVRFECPVAQLEVEAGRVAAALIAPQAAAWCPACGAAMAPDAPCAHCGFKGAPCVARLQEAPERITADAFISAVDLLGARAIFGEAPFAGQPFFDNLCQLPVSSPAIAYLWYPQPGATQTAWQARFGAREVLFSAGFKALGTTSNLTMIQPQRYSGGDLIESDLSPSALLDGPDEEVIAQLDGELRALIPDLPPLADARLLRWQDFTTAEVGSEARRPGHISPIDNLFFAGDWVATAQNCIYTEKCAVTARLVVNALLDHVGQAEGRMRIFASETPSVPVTLARRMFSAKPGARPVEHAPSANP